MDNQRPQLDLKFFHDICPDQNVPVVVVFTKYDQFLHNVEMHLVDYPNDYPDSDVSEVAEKQFQEYYLHPLGDDVRFVRLEKMYMQNSCCDDLIEKTAVVLNDDVVTLMLLAVQRGNLELSVKLALDRVHPHARFGVRRAKIIVRECLYPFPYFWLYYLHPDDLDDDPLYYDHDLDYDKLHCGIDHLNDVRVYSL